MTHINHIAKMNQDAYEAWLEALRAEDAKQTYGYLQTDEGECCLGVLCRVAVTKGLELDISKQRLVEGDVATYYDDSNKELPESVVEWAGMVDGVDSFSPHNPFVWVEAYEGSGFFKTLAELNDEGSTFTEIADHIEANRNLDYATLERPVV